MLGLFTHLGIVTAISMIFSENHSDQELAWDIEQFEKIRDDAETARDEIKSLAETLRSNVNQLQADWNTAAGKYFFEHLDSDWEVQVQKYVDTLDVFWNLMNDLVTEFKALEEAAENIRLGQGSPGFNGPDIFDAIKGIIVNPVPMTTS